MTNRKEPLQYLPPAPELARRIEYISSVWAMAGLPKVKDGGKSLSLPVSGGSIILRKIVDGYRLVFVSFPHKSVVLEQTSDSGSWSLLKREHKKTLANASKMTDVLFMDKGQLYTYVHIVMAKQGLNPKQDFTENFPNRTES